VALSGGLGILGDDSSTVPELDFREALLSLTEFDENVI
jgi:hypothetical protein